jgi:hypothetical protein
MDDEHFLTHVNRILRTNLNISQLDMSKFRDDILKNYTIFSPSLDNVIRYDNIWYQQKMLQPFPLYHGLLSNGEGGGVKDLVGIDMMMLDAYLRLYIDPSIDLEKRMLTSLHYHYKTMGIKIFDVKELDSIRFCRSFVQPVGKNDKEIIKMGSKIHEMYKSNNFARLRLMRDKESIKLNNECLNIIKNSIKDKITIIVMDVVSELKLRSSKLPCRHVNTMIFLMRYKGKEIESIHITFLESSFSSKYEDQHVAVRYNETMIYGMGDILVYKLRWNPNIIKFDNVNDTTPLMCDIQGDKKTCFYWKYYLQSLYIINYLNRDMLMTCKDNDVSIKKFIYGYIEPLSIRDRHRILHQYLYFIYNVINDSDDIDIKDVCFKTKTDTLKTLASQLIGIDATQNMKDLW